MRSPRSSRLGLVLLAVSLTVILSACGRVNLEDLTPEAVRTQEAIDAANVTPTPVVPTPAPGETPDASGGGQVDLLAGRSLYGNYCSGCHDNQRAGAQALLGRQGVDPAAAIEMLRSGTLPAGGTHNTYTTTEITDQQVRDIVAFFTQQ